MALKINVKLKCKWLEILIDLLKKNNNVEKYQVKKEEIC